MSRAIKPKSEAPAPASASRRQQLLEWLESGERGFEELRRELEVSARTLEEDLRHVDRTLRRGPRRLTIAPAVCAQCGFVFKGREPRHFHPPSRCPRCRSERIDEPRFALELPG